MKVTDKVSSQLQNLKSNQKEQANKSDGLNDVRTATNKDVAGSAKLNISQDAKARISDFNKIKEMATQAAEVNEAKVAKFRDLIDKGLYKVDAEKVADKLVDSSLRDAAMESD